MSKQRLRKKVQELVELREMADELAAEISAVEDEIKAHMNRTGTDTLEAGKHVVRWAVVKAGSIPKHSGPLSRPSTTTIPSPRKRAASPSPGLL